MPKYLLLLRIIFILIFCALLVACSYHTSLQKPDNQCKNHIDLNDDCLCDRCDARVEMVCERHTDNNHDGICDSLNCKHTLRVSHFDKDGDGICDSSECAEVLEDKKENDEPSDTPVENPKEEPEAPQEPEPPKEEPDEKEDPDLPEEPCKECIDSDENLICDVCGNKVLLPEPSGVVLVKNGKVRFSILIEYKNLCDAELEKINELIDYLRSVGISPEICDGTTVPGSDAKIIINSISFLGEEYTLDPHYLGPRGYSVTAEGDKILLRAGSGKALGVAIEYLKEKAFSLSEDEALLTEAVFLFSDSLENPQTDYKFNKVLIGDSDANGYKISYPTNDNTSLALARKIQNLLYENAGLWLEIIPSYPSDTEKCICIKTQDRSGGVGFFTRLCENGSLEIVSEFENKTLEAAAEYLASVFDNTTDTARFTESEINTRDIFYRDFGAIGDGQTNDFLAIKEAHDYANKHGHTVVADKMAVYYIGKTQETVTVRTSTVWRGAEFIIDDREIDYGSDAALSIFTVDSDYEKILLGKSDKRIIEINESGGLTRSTETINLSLGYSAILIIEDDTHKESVLIDGDGNIEDGHFLKTDFDTVKAITVIRADDTPITLEGGIFTHYSNTKRQSEPFARNIRVLRSNTTLRSLEYEMAFEPRTEIGASPYLAFIEITGCYNVTVNSFSFYARTSYAEGEESPIICAKFSHVLTLLYCKHNNFYEIDGFTPREDLAKAVCIHSSKKVSANKLLGVEIYS